VTMHGTSASWMAGQREEAGPPLGGFAVDGCGRCFTWVIAAGPVFRGEARLVPKVEGGG